MAEYIIEYPTIKDESNATILRELVRCKDCKYGVPRIDALRNPCIKCEKHPIYHPLDWFCADWERRK